MGKSLWRIFNRRSFRYDILTAFGALLLVTLLVVIIYNYRSTSRVVAKLSDDLMSQATQTVIDKTAAFLTPPAELAELGAQLFSSGAMRFGNMAKLERFAIECLHSQSQIAMFLIGDRKGNFLLSIPEPDGRTATKFVNRSVNPPLTTWKYWDKAFRVIRTEILTTDTYDPRSRPWYQGAEGKKGIYWTDLFIYYTGKKPGIAVSYPVFDLQGTVAGVIGCDIELVQLSTFLQSMKISKHGLAFILNDKQELVAFPEPTKVIDSQGEAGVLRPMRVDALNNPIIVTAYRKYRSTGQKKLVLEADGVRYHASFTNFPPSFGKPWQVAVVVPEDDFIGEVKKQTHHVFYISLFFLALSGILALLISRRISKPILQLAKETDNIRNFQLDAPLDLKSHISEIQVLGEAIDRTKISLRSFMRFAPHQLVQQVILDGKELLLEGERREVTLLFSDLRNFTHFAEHTRPEEVVHILNVHFDSMVKIISAHSGYVVDFLGDSLFAVFGAPEGDPDHTFQAIKCAVTMQLTRAKLNGELSAPDLPRLEMGIGINTGSCVVGNMGSQVRIKYGVVGHAVNLAARIETFTVGGQVLISEASRRLTEDLISVSGPFEAYGKGVEGAIQVWEVRGLHNKPDLTLPPTVGGLATLSEPVPVRFRLITGKQIASELYQATMIKLSEAGVALETALGLEDFAAIQLQLSGPAGGTIHIDGKVVGVDDARRYYIIRFSGLDSTSAAAVSSILAETSNCSRGTGQN